MSARKKGRAGAENPQKKVVDKKALCKNLLKLLILIAVTLTVYLIYSVLVEIYFYPVMITYTVLTTACILTYVIYNRGFSRKGLTPEMLPDTMSDEEKAEFIEDGNRRLKRSRPLLVVSFAFIFTFAMDIFVLYTIPFFAGLLGR